MPKRPEGPDLRMGVPLTRLQQGRPLLGYAGDDAVVLVRRGDELFAVGATCSHYGGPLAEGLVVGGTLRCPWHHACFSLRTGEALGAPALNPIPRWELEVEAGIVRVGKKQESAPLSPRGRQVGGPESVAIVGAGAAGSAAAEMLRRKGYGGPIALIDPDATAPYDRPNLSKDYLAGSAPEAWIPLRAKGFYEEHGIERIVAGVAALDTDVRALSLSDGRTLPFGALLLATGASPVLPKMPGADQPHVFTLRSLADCRAIIDAAEGATRAVVLGASFIGMEAAASLNARGLAITVVAPDTVPFQRTLGSALGGLILSIHEEHGVAFRLGHRADAIESNRVRLDDGSELEADLVVIGVGVRPNTGLARAAALAVEDGVLVDEYLETSVPGIYAAGDCARWLDARSREHRRIEHWVVAQRQGQAVANNMIGRREPFTDVPFFWTQHYDLRVAYVGHAARFDEVKIDGDPMTHDCSVRYLLGGRTLAVATVNRDRESLEAEAALAKEDAEYEDR